MAGPINGAALHRKLTDLVVLPLVVAGLIWIGKTVMGNERHLIEIDARLRTIEAKTALMPPADYRAYIDAKFAEMTRRFDDLTIQLRDHDRTR